MTDGRWSSFGKHRWISAEWFDYIPVDSDVNRFIVRGEYEIERARIPEYFSKENIAALDLYDMWKDGGWPFAGGWANQPAKIYDIIDALRVEAKKINAER